MVDTNMPSIHPIQAHPSHTYTNLSLHPKINNNNQQHVLDTVPDLLREGDKKYLMHQLLRGMAYMHDHWFLHRDLKVGPC
jgi:serine/threonine protein kinase